MNITKKSFLTILGFILLLISLGIDPTIGIMLRGFATGLFFGNLVRFNEK